MTDIMNIYNKNGSYKINGMFELYEHLEKDNHANDVTYVIGYWIIEKNIKHDLQHYFYSIPQTLKKLANKNIIFYYKDSYIYNLVKNTIQTDKIIFKKVNINELPTYNLSYHYLNSCKNQSISYINNKNEKGKCHYEREYLISGEEVFRYLFTIWTSKIYLINNAINENPFNTRYFAWCDAGISKTKPTFLNYNLKENTINAYNSEMNYLGNKIDTAAGFIISDENTWKKFIPLYFDQLEKSKHSNYAHDEETIIYLVYQSHKYLFNNLNLNNQIANILIENVSHAHNCCFINIPKTGGTTIELLIFNEHKLRTKEKPMSIHHSIDSYEKYSNYFIFTFVRNPYFRIISIFSYYKNGGNRNTDISYYNIIKHLELDNFLDVFNKNNMIHLNTQYSYLKNSKYINYIGKFENYQEDLKTICKFINFNIKDIPIIIDESYKNYLITPKFINLVNKIYNLDFVSYNYKKITLTDKILLDDFKKIFN